MHGFLLVDKPEGITSQDVITQLQHALVTRSGGKLKKRDLPSMGHGGTLDPFATGLLVVAIGDGVKLTRYLLGSEKTYEAEVSFGSRTASGDLTNEVVARTDSIPRDESLLRSKAKEFLERPYLQTPPMYSAKKIDGTPLYELARKGIEVERAAIECSVREFLVLETARAPSGGISKARIFTRVSSGTFIRTLAEDWAIHMGSLAHLTTLRRVSSGPLSLDQATPLKTLVDRALNGTPWAEGPGFLPFHRALDGILPRLEIDSETARRVFQGEIRTIQGLPLPSNDSIALYAENHLVAVVREHKVERGFPLRFKDNL